MFLLQLASGCLAKKKYTKVSVQSKTNFKKKLAINCFFYVTVSFRSQEIEYQ